MAMNILSGGTTDATTHESNEGQSGVGTGDASQAQAGRDSGGSEYSETDRSEHELLDADGGEDRELLPEARSRQEGAGLSTGGEGLSLGGSDSGSTVGRGTSEVVGEEAQEGGGSSVRFADCAFDADFLAVLDARKPTESIELSAPLSFGAIGEDESLSGVSLITHGEAKGHFMWVDQVFVAQVEAAMKSIDKLKCRFGHPSMFRDDRPTLGYFTECITENGQAKSKLKFLSCANAVPGYGDVKSYILSIAAEAPEMIGTSIVFSRDIDAEDRFIEENLKRDKDGKQMFVTPDALNTRNLPHVRLGSLMACDIVDSPAANPKGLFAASDATAKDIVRYIFGDTENMPEGLSPSVIAEANAGRAAFAEFLSESADRFLADAATGGEDMDNEELELEVSDEAPEADNESNVDLDDAINCLINFDGVAAAAAQIPRRDLLEKLEDDERESIAGLYREFDAKAPWERDPEGWAIYELWCAHIDKRGLILDDESIAAQLDLLGFHREASAVEALLDEEEDFGFDDIESDEDMEESDDEELSASDKTETESFADGEVDLSKVDLDTIRDMAREIAKDILSRQAGRLPE